MSAPQISISLLNSKTIVVALLLPLSCGRGFPGNMNPQKYPQKYPGGLRPRETPFLAPGNPLSLGELSMVSDPRTQSSLAYKSLIISHRAACVLLTRNTTCKKSAIPYVRVSDRPLSEDKIDTMVRLVTLFLVLMVVLQQCAAWVPASHRVSVS